MESEIIEIDISGFYRTCTQGLFAHSVFQASDKKFKKIICRL